MRVTRPYFRFLCVVFSCLYVRFCVCVCVWQHGMRCLKIPNTRAFHNITKIQDAMDLYERLKKETKARDFDSQNQEEFEDAAGNVLSKKTYQDLLRQGLL